MTTSRFSKRLPLALLAAGSLLAVSGCAWFQDPAASGQQPAAAAQTTGATTSPDGQTYLVVKADFTPLYRTGPQQPTGPDQSLPKDTLVTLLKRGFGFSRVQLESGLNGYVATEDLGPAPAELINPPQPVIAETSVGTNIENNSAIVERYSPEKAERSAATSTSNAEALPDLPEPRLEPEPEAAEKPDFRY
ncbi:MAG TPA: hypothetical protein VF585_10185 [Chthoniobacterales bacterium]|jgi:hypothetical protein